MKKTLFFIIVAGLFLSACNDPPLILNKVCSQNGTYCEDLKRTDFGNTVYQNLTTAFDTNSPLNDTVYEEITP